MQTVTIITEAGETVTVDAPIARHLIGVGKAKVAGTVDAPPEVADVDDKPEMADKPERRRRDAGADSAGS